MLDKLKIKYILKKDKKKSKSSTKCKFIKIKKKLKEIKLDYVRKANVQCNPILS